MVLTQNAIKSNDKNNAKEDGNQIVECSFCNILAAA